MRKYNWKWQGNFGLTCHYCGKEIKDGETFICEGTFHTHPSCKPKGFNQGKI